MTILIKKRKELSTPHKILHKEDGVQNKNQTKTIKQSSHQCTVCLDIRNRSKHNESIITAIFLEENLPISLI